MNANELVTHIAENHGIERKAAKQVLDAAFGAIIEAAVNGDEVSINGFGKFKVSARDARQGRNPATGETIQIAASKKLAFTPAKAVKDRMNEPPAKTGRAAAGKAASKPARAPERGARPRAVA